MTNFFSAAFWTEWGPMVQALTGIVYVAMTGVLVYFTLLVRNATITGPAAAVEAARNAASQDELRRKRADHLMSMMQHLIAYSAAWSAHQVALEARGNAYSNEANAAAAGPMVSAERDFHNARGAISVDLQLLDYLFDPSDQRLNGVRKHVGDFIQPPGPTERRDPTPEAASAICGVIHDAARSLGLFHAE